MRVFFDAFWWVDGPISNRIVVHETVNAWRSSFPADDLRGRTFTERHSSRCRARSRRGGSAPLLTPPRVGRRHRDSPSRTLAGSRRCTVPELLPTTGHFPGRTGRLHPRRTVPVQSRVVHSPRTCVFLGDAAPGSLRVGSLQRSATEGKRIRTLNRHITCPVTPVGLGVSTSILSGPASKPAGVDDGLEFVLSVGRLNVRKNLLATIQAAIKSEAISPARPLLIVGEPQGKTDRALDAVRRATDDGTVIFLGMFRTKN